MESGHARSPAAGRYSLGFSWPLLVAACAFLALLTRPAQLLGDGDVYWHVAAGRWIAEHLAIPASDPFSYTLRGAPWIAHEWLAEVVYGGAYAMGGWAAVAMVAAAAFATTLALLNRFLLCHLEPIYALLLTAMSASLLAPHLFARPHTLVAPVMTVWAIGLVRAREKNIAPPWPLACILVLWANLHGSFVLGPALAMLFAAEAALESDPGAPRRRALTAWSAFLAISLAASMVTPFGPRGLLFAIELDQMPFALSAIGEWRSINFQQFHPLELWLLISGGAMLLLGLKLPPVRIVLLLGLLHLALKHARHADLLALLAPVAAAQPFAAQLAARRNQAGQAETLDRYFAALVPPARPATAGLVLVFLAAVGWVTPQTVAVRPVATMTPELAVRAAAAQGVRGPVLNSYEFGGYLIFSGMPPFIDSRADLYGDTFLRAYGAAINLESPELLPQLLEKHRIAWTLLSPGTPAVSLLDRLPGWRRIYADKIAVMHMRDQS